ncbi:hypothetical protein SAMN05428974_1350 [Sphingopyxis sp. YR583]|uniref:hypothetical protein n=1 Tax=Sphingopyxis sp. YR583 TaxID=1881047 RepID=UPI0008A753B5|nr:hypothetical protein [Sphingopyxis sp. YR583]SEH15094.1 hypothetical protein SAMN05428974_1350 [Sphingopyxis sp. YR583]
MYSTLDGAKKCAKQLKRLLEASALIFPLARCQASVAEAGGYQDWHDLNRRIGQRPQTGLPFDYWGNLLKVLPAPCQYPVRSHLSGRGGPELAPPEMWVRDILPYAVSLEIVHRTHAAPLRPGSGKGQRLRLELVSGLLLNIEGGLDRLPKLDAEKLHLIFDGEPASLLPKLARNAQFSEAVSSLVDAGLLRIERGSTYVLAPESDVLKAELLERALTWRRDQEPKIDYIEMDEDLAGALAHQESLDVRDSGPKVPYHEMSYRGVELQSRYAVAHEFEEMKAVVDAMPDDVRLRVESIWCDSKACAVYSITIRLGMDRSWLGENIRDSFRAGTNGFNGLFLSHGNDDQFFDPEWPEDDEDFLPISETTANI